MQKQRVFSGMRPTGHLHLGHYHGVLKNWVEMQHSYECLFCIVDWHALTTHYDDTSRLQEYVFDMAVEWLAVGVDPTLCTLFVQSQVPEHAELHLLLSMITPLPWLERIPSYKDQQVALNEKDLSTFGFLGYPLLQAADILAYKATRVPVGEDQVSHIEFAREIARRFNFIYGKEPNFEERVASALSKMGKKEAKSYQELCTAYREQGNKEALHKGLALLEAERNLSAADKERLQGHLEGTFKIVLPEVAADLTKVSKMPGLDGRKMSKSYHNTIMLRESPEAVSKKIRTMPTDPARVRRQDPGEPEKCPVWQFHRAYSSPTTQEWVLTGCRSAGIGCLECKAPIIEAIQKELAPIQEKIKNYEAAPERVHAILAEGCKKARAMAKETLREVREQMRLYHGE